VRGLERFRKLHRVELNCQIRQVLACVVVESDLSGADHTLKNK
jgi:hypothetical protein